MTGESACAVWLADPFAYNVCWWYDRDEATWLSALMPSGESEMTVHACLVSIEPSPATLRRGLRFPVPGLTIWP